MAQSDRLLEVELERDEVSAQAAQSEAARKTFWALHGRLLDQYEGQAVAIHQGQVVAHDTDKLKPGLRVYRRFGYQPAKHLGKNLAVLSVGADLCVCPGVRPPTGADTQVCPYAG